MSAGYWGIVSGVAALIVLLFVCIEISCRKPKSAPGQPHTEETKRAA